MREPILIEENLESNILSYFQFIRQERGIEKINMNISVTNQHVEFNEIQQLVKFTAGLEVEVLVAISSCCILSDNRYTSSKVRLNKCVGFSLKRNYKRTSMLLSMLSYDR